MMLQDHEKTEEFLLLTCSPLLHEVAMKQFAEVLGLTVTTIGGEVCMLGDIRIDVPEGKLYGRGHKIPTYEAY